MRIFALSIVVAFVCACGVPETPSSVVVTDSAGIRVVQQGGLSLLPVVDVVATPDFEIGWGDGVEFEDVPVGRLQENGTAVVFDEGAASLYFISSDGSAVTSVGTGGEGPGEFRSVGALVALPGDTLIAYDRALGRLSRMAPDGRFVDSGSWIQGGGVRSRPAGATSSGQLAWIPDSYALERGQEGTVIVTGSLLTSEPLGAAPDTLADVRLVTIDFEQGRPSRDPFMRFGMGGGYSGGFVWTYNEIPEARWYTEEGSLRQIARWQAEPTSVDELVWDRYEGVFTSRMMSRPRRPTDEQLATQLRDARDSAAETLPYFTFHALSHGGDVWLSDYRMMAGPAATYVRLEADGVARDVIVFPQPIRILDVRDGRVLGVVTNELDVQAVVTYDLR